MALFDKSIAWGIKEHVFHLVLGDVMFYDQLLNDIGQPNEIIDIH
jgi:hypothetical protein